ncbi:unnamed protein product, partial [Iphiclides podalirius]
MSTCEDVIDLTDSFTLIEHSSLADDVIIIDTDESLSSNAKSPVNTHSKPKRQKEPSNKESSVRLTNESSTESIRKHSLHASVPYVGRGSVAEEFFPE